MPRRLPDDDDDDDDDLGLRTPVKKPAKSEPPKQAEKPKADTKSEKRPRTDPKTPAVEERAAPRKTPSGKREALERPAARGSKAGVMALAGLVVVAAIGGGVALFAMPADGPPPTIGKTTEPTPVPTRTGPVVELDRDPGRAAVALTPPPRVDGPPVLLTEAKPATAAEVLDKLAELRRRSANHEAIARLLEEYAQLTRIDPMAADPNFVGFREREEREQQLLAELQRLGAAVVPALQEMLLELDQRAQQLFLCKALAGIDCPEALAAVEHVLQHTRDVALQTTLVRFLPDTPQAAQALSRAFGREQNPNLRSMLLREYARRLGESDDSGRETFAQAALKDPDPNVRAEAITIIGRRGDKRDQEFLMQVIRQEENLPIRQRAIVSYAETGKDDSLPFLEGLARDPNGTLPIRASAVLAIGRVGGDRAVQALDQLALTDPDQEIRLRAQRMAASIRARQQAEREGNTAVEPEGPIPVPHNGPSPLDRN